MEPQRLSQAGQPAPADTVVAPRILAICVHVRTYRTRQQKSHGTVVLCVALFASIIRARNQWIVIIKNQVGRPSMVDGRVQTKQNPRYPRSRSATWTWTWTASLSILSSCAAALQRRFRFVARPAALLSHHAFEASSSGHRSFGMEGSSPTRPGRPTQRLPTIPVE